MDEVIPIIFGAVLGAAISVGTNGISRIVLSILVVVVSAAVAVIASGEYLQSWAYLLLDLGEASFGLALGYVVGARLSPMRAGRKMAAER